jgi:hypothetical protein
MDSDPYKQSWFVAERLFNLFAKNKKEIDKAGFDKFEEELRKMEIIDYDLNDVLERWQADGSANISWEQFSLW